MKNPDPILNLTPDQQEEMFAGILFFLLQSTKLCKKDLEYISNVFMKHDDFEKASIVYELIDKEYYDQSPSRIEKLLEGVELSLTLDNLIQNKAEIINNINIEELIEVQNIKKQSAVFLDFLTRLVEQSTAFSDNPQPFLIPPLTGKNLKNFVKIITDGKKGVKRKKIN